MSFDFALQRACNHQVYMERHDLDQFARNTIRFIRPISSINVRIFINGDEVPSQGLYSKAFLPLGEAPYRLEYNKSDLLYIKVGSAQPKFIQLLTGPQVSADDLVKHLQPLIPDLDIYASEKRVYFSSRDPVNGTAFSFPDPRWTDKTSSSPETTRVLGAFTRLKIIPGRSVFGKLLYPGWDIIKDPTSYVDERVLLFRSPIVTSDPVIQVSYVTTSENCRRCFGSRMEFDYGVIGSQYEIIQNADLLLQEFDKFLFTKIGSHWKWPWLGSNLSNRIGGKATTGLTTVGSFLTLDVSQAFRTYQNIKQQQDDLTFQRVTDAEYPFAIEDLQVQEVPNDPTTAIINVVLRTRSREVVEITRIVGNPNPLFIEGNPNPFLLRA